ncbi:hypothetical protein [Bowmanella sp. JS7-9]|uniref:Uncharacterized protein n=1 Tax=Pseudobowmanella zhangzhouensis TaxID=1537679 RepID=A0ABW1XHE6_9ALTE|nr:hypothetical protein [Bowmanella sp. JS7-9]
MLRLSKRAWNNVLIFASLFMIVLFNFSNKLMLENANQTPLTLLPADAMIQRIEFGQQELQRIGRGWRLQPMRGDEVDLNQIIQNWQQVILTPTERSMPANPYVITLWLAGEEKGRVVTLAPVEQQLLLAYQGQPYQVALSLNDLIPSGSQ